jgi:hypothetical protein
MGTYRASILASGGMPLFILRALLGHSSVKMIERYVHLAAGQSATFSHLLSAAAPAIESTNEAPVSGPQAGPHENVRRGAALRCFVSDVVSPYQGPWLDRGHRGRRRWALPIALFKVLHPSALSQSTEALRPRFARSRRQSERAGTA